MSKIIKDIMNNSRISLDDDNGVRDPKKFSEAEDFEDQAAAIQEMTPEVIDLLNDYFSKKRKSGLKALGSNTIALTLNMVSLATLASYADSKSEFRTGMKGFIDNMHKSGEKIYDKIKGDEDDGNH